MNPVALITGASRGIGRGIALELAALGWDLLLNYRSNVAAAQSTAAACLESAAAKKPIRVEICEADISREADRRKLIEHGKRVFGRLDLLVNNAGVAPAIRADILEATEESFDQVLATNLKGPYFLTQLAANWMLEQQKAEGAAAAGRATGSARARKI